MSLSLDQSWAYRELSLSSRAQAPGTTVATLCPLCRGGSTADLSMSVTKREDGVVLFCCHRATCGFSGRLNDHGTRGGGETPAPVFTPRFYWAPLQFPLADTYWADHLTKLFSGYGTWTGLANECVLGGWRVEVNDPECLAYPCKDFDGEVLGYQTRRRKLEGGKTVRTFREKPGPFYATYTGRRSVGPLWLVEDVFSARAIQLANGRAAALLGTHAPGPLLDLIVEKGWPVVVALDPGAELAAGRVYTDLVVRGARTRIQPLHADVKNMPPGEVVDLVSLWTDAFSSGMQS